MAPSGGYWSDRSAGRKHADHRSRARRAFIETSAGTVLCDPWVNPAFFGSWFPFPAHSDLDWDALGQADYLYVSHQHRDHFDAELLGRHVRKDTTVLLPDYPIDELERELAGLGFRTFLRTSSGVPVRRDGRRIMITSLTGPSDGPIGDSALSLDDGRTVILNQNDAHPLDIEQLRDFGEVHGYFSQSSGAIWWPMVYDLPAGARREFARRKRAGQTDRGLRYIDAVGAAHVFPAAGPPCFLDEDLFEVNGQGCDRDSIFTDQMEFLAELRSARPGVSAHLLLPGSIAELDGSRCELTHRRTRLPRSRTSSARRTPTCANTRPACSPPLRGSGPAARRCPLPAGSASTTSSSTSSSNACRRSASTTSRTGTTSATTTAQRSIWMAGGCNAAARTCAPTWQVRQRLRRNPHLRLARAGASNSPRVAA